MPGLRVRSLGPAVVVAAALLAACAGPATPGQATGTPTDSPSPDPGPPALSLDALDAAPVENRDESVALAFDREDAASLLLEVPDDLDFASQVVVCVFLGPRQTTGWSLDLRTATLRDGQLEIKARENAPRAGTRPEVTYPADCGLLTRAALPIGELAVRADDTITGEFIAGTTVVVPNVSNAP